MNEGTIFVLIVLIGIVVGLAFYFIPSIVAFRRRHVNRMSIFLVNFLLGWSLVGWVIALVWAFKEPEVGNYPPRGPQ